MRCCDSGPTPAAKAKIHLNAWSLVQALHTERRACEVASLDFPGTHLRASTGSGRWYLALTFCSQCGAQYIKSRGASIRHVYVPCTHMPRSESCTALLLAIDSHPAVCRTMREIGESLSRLMCVAALDYSMGWSQLFQNVLKSQHDSFASLRYHGALSLLTKLATTRNVEDSGCILHEDVLRVLCEGNTRERCFVFMNLMFRQPRAVLFSWILQRSHLYYLSCLNERVVEAYRARLCSAADEGNTTFRRALSQHTAPQHRRRARSPTSRDAHRLAVHEAVPAVSQREARLSRFRGHTHAPTHCTPWKTGRMQWELVELSDDLLETATNGNELVCGASGHTDALLSFSRVLECYDLRVMTLVAMVWLVGADHHSLCEVLLAARSHGLPYNYENAELFTLAMLESVS